MALKARETALFFKHENQKHPEVESNVAAWGF
jgi:hypothetical protein